MPHSNYAIQNCEGKKQSSSAGPPSLVIGTHLRLAELLTWRFHADLPDSATRLKHFVLFFAIVLTILAAEPPGVRQLAKLSEGRMFTIPDRALGESDMLKERCAS